MLFLIFFSNAELINLLNLNDSCFLFRNENRFCFTVRAVCRCKKTYLIRIKMCSNYKQKENICFNKSVINVCKNKEIRSLNIAYICSNQGWGQLH